MIGCILMLGRYGLQTRLGQNLGVCVLFLLSKFPSNNRLVNFTLSYDLRTSWTTSDVAPIITPQITGTRMQARNPTMWYDQINNELC